MKNMNKDKIDNILKILNEIKRDMNEIKRDMKSIKADCRKKFKKKKIHSDTVEQDQASTSFMWVIKKWKFLKKNFISMAVKLVLKAILWHTIGPSVEYIIDWIIDWAKNMIF